MHRCRYEAAWGNFHAASSGGCDLSPGLLTHGSGGSDVRRRGKFLHFLSHKTWISKGKSNIWELISGFPTRRLRDLPGRRLTAASGFPCRFLRRLQKNLCIYVLRYRYRGRDDTRERCSRPLNRGSPRAEGSSPGRQGPETDRSRP